MFDHFFSLQAGLTDSFTQQLLTAYSFFDGARHGGILRFEVLTEPEKWKSMSRFEAPIDEKTFPEVDQKFRQVLEKLHLIEHKTGVAFALTDQGIGRRDWELIHEVSEILETGKLLSRFDKQSQTLHGARGSNGGLITIKALLESWRENKPVSMEAQVEQVEVEILKVKIPLGKLHMRLSGALEPECAKRLEEVERAEISPNDLEFVLINGEYEQEFLEWMGGPSALPPFPRENGLKIT